MATSSWKLDDLEQVGLAAELESTNLGSLQHADFEAYNMSEVLTNLLKDDQQTYLPPDCTMGPFAPDFTSPLSSDTLPKELLSTSHERFSFMLKAPTALGIKCSQEQITYINKGQPYEVQLQANSGLPSPDTLYKCVVSLGFNELRLRNCEQELFEQWSKDHPVDRLLEIDKVGCDGLSHLQNDEHKLNSINFIWSPMQTSAILSLRVNCLSTEFAARKHGGEKGVPLQLQVETYCLSGNGNGQEFPVHVGVCCVKVFKDKGADRKQKQDQQKMEKMAPSDLAKYHPLQNTTQFRQVDLVLPSVTLPTSPTSPHYTPHHTPHNTSNLSTPSENSPYYQTTPTKPNPTNQNLVLNVRSSVQETHDWLAQNRFTSYVSLFANYTGADLLRLTRRDLIELCGAADGIRLFNTLRSRTVKVVYITMGQEKVYQALCLEQLSAHELLVKVTSKLGLTPAAVSSFVRVTLTGIMVLVDDTLVENLAGEETFMLQTMKEEGSGRYQVILRELETNTTFISAQGALPRTPL